MIGRTISHYYRFRFPGSIPRGTRSGVTLHSRDLSQAIPAATIEIRISKRSEMKRTLVVLAGILLVLPSAPAQETDVRDAQIERMVGEVSKDSLRTTIVRLVAFGTRHTLSNSSDGKRGIVAARGWILGRFLEWGKLSGGRLTALIDTTTIPADGKRIDAPALIGNVIATLEGTDPEDTRVYVISGHLDSRASDPMNRVSDAPGADDDGSGTAAVIECARVMSRYSFPATIVFAVVSGEEQGLFGSTSMAGRAKSEHRNIDAVLNNDIMGGSASGETGVTDNTHVRVFSEGLPVYELDRNASKIRALGLENDGKSRQLARYVKEICSRYVPNLQAVMIYRNDRFLRGGDQTPYVENGYAAVRITEMNEDYRHQHQDVRVEEGVQYGDLPAFIDFEYLRKNTSLNLACLANLAKSPAPPREVTVEVRRLTNWTSLTWNGPGGGRLKGYYVLMRETTSPVWEKKTFTAAAAIQVPYSKDNYFFAVQSVSADGNESLPVVPVVLR
jgi:hypothetical protein